MSFPVEVTRILRQLEGIPYENLTKIVTFKQYGRPEQSLDTPEKLYRKSIDLGAGGTCFSMTFYLRDLLLQGGFHTEFLMGDKYNSSNIHCGLLFKWEGEEYLLDPGYMIFDPLMIPHAGLRLYTPLVPNAVCLEDIRDKNVWRLYTGRENNLKMRFDFRKNPVSEKDFMQYWKDTFFFNMMEYPVLNKTENQVQYYLQKRTFLTRTREGSKVEELSGSRFRSIASGVFGISNDVVEDFLDIILTKRKDLFLPD